MSQSHQELTLGVSTATALAACRSAASALGWRIVRDEAATLVCDEIPKGMLALTNPVRIEISAHGAGDGSTKVVLKASNLGFGPIQSSHVKSQVQVLSRLIESTASRPAKASPHTRPATARSVVINGAPLGDDQVLALEHSFRVRIQDGQYWYDRLSGAWGFEGGPTVGFILPNLNLGGTLRSDASNGNTGVFINGRQLHALDVRALQQIIPAVLPGRYWVDGQGNFGAEGGPMLGNLWILAGPHGAPHGGPWSRREPASGVSVGGDGEGFIYAMGKDGSGNCFNYSIDR